MYMHLELMISRVKHVSTYQVRLVLYNKTLANLFPTCHSLYLPYAINENGRQKIDLLEVYHIETTCPTSEY